MRRLALLVAAVCLLAPAVGTLPVGAADANVTVSNLSVSPTTPVPGETIRIEATVQSLSNSAEPVEVDAVALRTRGGRFNEYDRIRDLGTLSPGASIPVPLTVRFGEPGTKRLEVVVYGDDDDGDGILARYPVSVTVQDGKPRVGLDVGRAAAGAETTAAVTVANGLDRDLRGLELTLEGGLTDDAPRRVLSTLPAGETRTFTFNVTPESAGEANVTARLDYTLPGGTERTVTQSTAVDVLPRRERVTLNATATTGLNGSRGAPAVSVDVANTGNVPVERVVVRGRSSNATVGQAVVESLPPGATRTVRLGVSNLDGPTSVTVRGVYEVDGRTNRTVEQTVDVRANPGRVELTGLDSADEGDYLRISGSASNVGLQPVNSVVVRVLATEDVEPSPPNREYFVGTVPASDFVSFDVSAQVGANVSRVPLEVTYLSDGTRRTETVQVPIEPAVGGAVGGADGGGSNGGGDTDGTDGGGGSGGLLLPVIGTLVVLLVVAGFVAVAWRNRRDSA